MIRHLLYFTITFIVFLKPANCQQEYHDPNFGIDGMTYFPSDYQAAFGKLLKFEDGFFAFAYAYPGNHPKIVKYDNSGNLDNSFNGVGYVETNLSYDGSGIGRLFQGYIDLTTDNKIIAVSCAKPMGENSEFIGRFNIDGSLDTSYGVNGYVSSPFEVSAQVFEVKKLTNDDLIIVATNSALSPGMYGNIYILKIDSNGNLITEFGTGGIMKYEFFGDERTVAATGFTDDSSLLIAWDMDQGDDELMMLDLDSQQIDMDFGNSGFLTINNSSDDEKIEQFKVNENGEILLTILFQRIPTNVSLVKYDAQQQLVADFGLAGISEIYNENVKVTHIQLTEDKIYVMGYKPPYSPDIAFFKRYNLNGGIDATFGNEGTILRTLPYPIHYDMLVYEQKFITGGFCLLDGIPSLQPCLFSNIINPDMNTEETVLSEANFYPNPTNGVLYINSADQQVIRIEIYDLSGRLVSTVKNISTKVDVSNLPSATYIFKFFYEKSSSSIKIIKN